MPAAVLEVDVAQPLRDICGLARYEWAHILFRLDGRPVGAAILSVERGAISKAQLQEAVRDRAGWALSQRLLDQFLEDGQPTPSSVLPLATVAVCTRDRPDDVRRCLESLQKLPDDGQEILVIDNCPSTDETERVVGKFTGVRYVRESSPGLDIARNRALREARHAVVAFSDDDAAPGATWLRSLLRNFDDPRVMCVTGLTMPLELETNAQQWFERYSPFGRGFERRVFDGAHHNPLHTGPIGAGANMAIRRSVLDEVGAFDEALDAGTVTHSGGDHDMFARVLAAGYQIVYEPCALSRHRHRRTWPELERTIYGYGVGVYAMWTCRLLEGNPAVFGMAWSWFRHEQARRWAKWALRRPDRMPSYLLLAEVRGCIAGPRLYLRSRQRLRQSRAQKTA